MFDLNEIPRPILAALEPISAVDVPRQGATSQVAIVTSGSERWVVKHANQAPFHEWLEREYRVLQALGGSGLPAPLALVLVARGGPDGPDHWLLMTHLPGDTLERRLEVAAGAQRRRLLRQFGAMLWRIHQTPVPPALVSPQAWIDRQFAQAMTNRAHYDVDGSPELLQELLTTRPWPKPVAQTLIHGDYMLDNVLVSGDEISGVIDWSAVTNGDPRHDLALATQPHRGVFSAPNDLDAFYSGYGGTRLQAEEARFFLDLDEFF